METKSEQTLDAIPLPPSIKHKTILETYEHLKEGETFILHNDHDPKPLYYQFSATKGDTFTWEYLKQGPDIFEIRIGKKRNTDADIQSVVLKKVGVRISIDDKGRETVSSIVAKDIRKIAVFQKFHIDCFWKAQKTITEACNESGVNQAELEKALNEVTHDTPPTLPSQDYNLWDMEFLADYILQTHHQYVKDRFEIISALAEKVAAVHGRTYPEFLELGKGVRPMIVHFMDHMGKEESVLFPAIKRMAGLLAEGKKPQMNEGSIANAIERMEAEHDETGEALRHFKNITNNYTVPDRAGDTIVSLYKLLEEFERDTYHHVHLENNILFPKTVILENKLLGK